MNEEKQDTLFDYIEVSFAVDQISRHLCWRFAGPDGKSLFHQKGPNAGMVVLLEDAAIKCRVTVYPPEPQASAMARKRSVRIIDCQVFAVPRQASASPTPFEVARAGTPVFASFMPPVAELRSDELRFESGDFYFVRVKSGNWDLSMILTAEVTDPDTGLPVLCRYRFDPEGVGGTQDVQ